MHLMIRTPTRLFACLLVTQCFVTLECVAASQTVSSKDHANSVDHGTISLAETWRFALDPEDVGADQQWFSKNLDDTVQLPGTTDETFIGRVQIAHYGPADLPDARVTWTVNGSNGRKLTAGAFDTATVEQGKVFEVDMFSLPLGDIAAPRKLTITVAIEGTEGKMLICAIDLLGQQDKPAARQLLHSLLRYIDSVAFAPQAALDADLLKKLLPK